MNLHFLDVKSIRTLFLFLALTAGAKAYSAAFQSGAYINSMSVPEKAVCVSNANLVEMQAENWQQAMKKRGKNCQIIEAEKPMPSLRRWKANCSDERGQSYEYSFSVSGTAPSDKTNRLLIDSKITNQAGELKGKMGFWGDYQGTCTAAMEAFPVWDYFDLPGP